MSKGSIKLGGFVSSPLRLRRIIVVVTVCLAKYFAQAREDGIIVAG